MGRLDKNLYGVLQSYTDWGKYVEHMHKPKMDKDLCLVKEKRISHVCNDTTIVVYVH